MRYLAMALAFCLAAAAFGDIVHLKTGGSLEGEVVQTEDGVIVKMAVGEVRVPKDAIARIEPKKSLLQEYSARAAAVKEGDVEAHYKLGTWAQDVGLKDQAKAHFLTVIGLSPNHAEARKALGYALVDGKWVSEEEVMRARGLIKFDGQWMTPDAAAKLQTLKAELEVAREKRLAAEAELKRMLEEIRASQAGAQPGLQPEMPPVGPNPYDAYFQSRDYRNWQDAWRRSGYRYYPPPPYYNSQPGYPYYRPR